MNFLKKIKIKALHVLFANFTKLFIFFMNLYVKSQVK